MNWRFKILKIIWTPGVGIPLPRGIIHVFNHNIQRSSSLKPLGQPKSNFIGSICMKGKPMYLENKPGHITKMATMPIYGKNPSKTFFAGTAEPIATKIDTIKTRVLQCVYKS